ncbi:hypothetical protein OH76DRAFT_1388127 [Lentinus brumalis]|uniref:F-box domain-containing protein n=1 Tax=Lentinus brumalis TaxID=2498619 RepID=A0A371CYK3_9APHY|nr:hypothetical protein OH76DRAFT_1388127 [Polyporus brumalis]
MDAATTSAAEKVPAEIWLEIFALVPKSTDLYSLSVASRRFHDLTTRALHLDLVWLKQSHAAQNLAVWERNEGMEPYVRSLEISLGCPPSTVQNALSTNDWLFGDNTPAARLAAADVRRNFTEATERVTGALWERVQRFTNVSSLALVDMYIDKDHFRLIHSLPQLRSLRIEACVFQANAAEGFDNRKLPITELTMLNVRRGHDAHVNHDPMIMNLQQFQQLQLHGPPAGPGAGAPMWINPPDPFAQALSLAVAENLRTLSVDASADVFRYVFGSSDAPARGWTVPASIEELYVVRKRTITAPEPKQSPHWAGAQSTFPDTHLYHFCAQAPSLKVVSTPIFVPAQVTIAAEALPLGLERFAAPVETAQFIATVRDVKALGLLKCGLSSREGVTALASIALVRPGLKMLMMECKGWDAEIVSAVSRHFKELRRLKIVYDGPGPDENFLVSLAPDFLAEMPELHTLEMYQLPPRGEFAPVHPPFLWDSSFASIEDELRDTLIGWTRFCPNLRKVQLVSGYAMTRGFEGGLWKLEKVRRLEQIEYLDY